MLLFLTTIKDELVRSQLEEIYRLYNKDLLYIANEILKDPHEAEDVVQSAYIKIFHYLGKNIDIKCNKTRGLIVIIVRSIAINLYHQKKRRATIDIDGLESVLLDENCVDPEINVLRLDKSEWVARQLDKIKQEYADILTLKYEYDFSDGKIAGLCCISEGNVRVRLARAKKSLYGVIEGDIYG